tara:strand:- start:25 stop:2409 length:2385 start_codon:yes stop_codon:yes gene_type:complete
MATNNIGGAVDIGATTGGNQVVTPVVSNMAQQVATVASGALQIGDQVDRTIRKTEVREGAEKNLEQFNQDLEHGVSDESIAELSKNDPAFKKYVSAVNKLTLAERQGLATPMLQLRAEAELKKAIARAPGLRAELRGAAQNALGFDPTGEAIKKLMYTPSGRTATDPTVALNKTAKAFARSNGYPTKGTNGVDMSYAALSASNEELSLAETRVANAAQADDVEVQQIGRDIVTLMSAKSAGVADSFLGTVKQVNTPAQLKEWQSTALPEIENWILASTSAVERMVSQMPANTPAQIRAREIALEDAMKPISGAKRLLESNDITKFHQNAQTLELMGALTKYDFAEQFTMMNKMQIVAAPYLQASMPSMLVNNPGLMSKVSATMSDAYNNLDVEAKDVDQLLDLISGKKAYADLDVQGRQKASKMSMRYLRKALKDGDASSATPADMENLSRNYAVAMAGIDVANPADQRALVDMLSSPALVKMHDKLLADDSNDIKANAIADSTVTMLSNYASTTGLKDLIASARTASMDVTYNYATQSFEAANKPEAPTVGFDSRNARRNVVNNPLKQGTWAPLIKSREETNASVARLNKALDAVVANGHFDPWFSKLTPEEIKQTVINDGLLNNDVRTVGEQLEITTPNPAQQRSADNASFSQGLQALNRSTAQKAEEMKLLGYMKGTGVPEETIINMTPEVQAQLLQVVQQAGGVPVAQPAPEASGTDLSVLVKLLGGKGKVAADKVLELSKLGASAEEVKEALFTIDGANKLLKKYGVDLTQGFEDPSLKGQEIAGASFR